MMKRLIVVLVLVLLLAACIPAIPQTGGSSSQQSPVKTQQQVVTDEPAPLKTAEVIGSECSTADREEGVPVLLWSSRYWKFRLTLIDVTNGLPVCSVKPIDLGASAEAVLSPDGKTIAVFDYPNKEGYNGKLLLVDLQAWALLDTGIKLNNFISARAFNASGDQIAFSYLSNPYWSDRSKAPAYTLAVYDLISPADSATVSEVELMFNPRFLRFFQDGKSLVAYGAVDGMTREDIPAPTVAVFDAGSLQTVWSEEVAGLKDGYIFREAQNGPEEMINVYSVPAVVMSPDDANLYVISAEDNQFARINLIDRTIEVSSLVMSRTLLERFLSWNGGTATAKMMDGVMREAVISRDGSRIYTIGFRESVTPNDSGEIEHQSESLGLMEIDAATGVILNELEIEATGITWAPDGEHLITHSWLGAANELFVIDPRDLSVTTRIPGTNVSIFPNLGGDPKMIVTRELGNSTIITPIDITTFEQKADWRADSFPIFPHQ
jgi:hypothetical protein